MNVTVDLPRAYIQIFSKKSRYKVLYGGRGSGKSYSCARALLAFGWQKPMRILCAREIQRSINDSVHKLLCSQIEEMGLGGFYSITRDTIRGANGTEIIFKGLRTNPQEIKSTEGIDICWVEEAQAVSAESWDVLIPTIRKPDSEIWLTFNPLDTDDPTFQRFVVNPPENAIIRKINYDENPHFPEVLKREMEWLKERDYESYLHIWKGEVRRHSDAVIFSGRFRVEDFETDRDARFYHGCDWGFANDPTVLIRCYIKDRTIYIDREAWGVGVDLDETPALFDTIETARTWAIKADNARPETISFMRRRGYRISGAKKWAGSVEDGIEYLKSYDIVIHPRCRHTIDEFEHYSYKIDRQTGDILPIVTDAWNHCLTGDTLIACEDGEKLITDVKAGEYVHTREGLKKVLWSGETRRNACVFSVMAGGYKVTGTADHKIYTVNRGWVQIGHIQKGDILLCLQRQSRLTGKHGTDTRNPADGLTANISSAGQCGCIDTHGSASAEKSQQEWSYITRTGTAKTTPLTISNALRKASTGKSIRLMAKSWNGKGRTWSGFGQPHQLGMGANQDINGIANTQKRRISDTITENRDNASNAGKHSNPKRRITNFAPTLAKAHGDERQELTTKKGFAQSADSPLLQTNTLAVYVAPKVVDSVTAGGIENAVYDLTVEGAHEFFANGVLVHNCIDALRYSQDGLIKGRGQMVINPMALMG